MNTRLFYPKNLTFLLISHKIEWRKILLTVTTSTLRKRYLNRDLKQNMFTKGFHTFTLWAKLFLFGSLGGILPFGRLVQAPESIS